MSDVAYRCVRVTGIDASFNPPSLPQCFTGEAVPAGEARGVPESSVRAINVADLRALAKRRLPRVVFDYIDGGAEGEVTLLNNVRAFESVTFRPRNAVANAPCDLRVTVLGTSLELPFILAPVGSSRLFYPRGECTAARAAGEAGTAYTLSTLAGSSLEDVKAASSGPVWYQVYLIGGREVTQSAIERARQAGYAALVVTVDTAVAGFRERDVRNGAKALLAGSVAMMPHVAQVLARPRWLLDFLRDGGLMQFPNVMLADGPMRYADVEAALEQSTVAWSDLTWIREVWGPAPIVVKGVLTGDDARRAVDAGANGVIVSNHGGRQLDGVSATLRALPEIVAAVGDRVEVLLDSGVRRGSDVVKALCLGARAVLVGRAYAYGLAAAGGPGVGRAIEILRSGVIRTLRLLGCHSISDLDSAYVEVPKEWPVPGLG